MSGEISLFTLDLLPPKCSVESQVRVARDGAITARFRAERRVGRLRRRAKSEWSHWLRYEGEPIALRWATFWT